jgi:hypothetical protein
MDEPEANNPIESSFCLPRHLERPNAPLAAPIQFVIISCILPHLMGVHDIPSFMHHQMVSSVANCVRAESYLGQLGLTRLSGSGRDKGGGRW